MTVFSYAEMTTRNTGFVSADEQARLKGASVFIPGVGGMGGAAFMALVRAGVGRFTIADLDVFEVSNLNRQFASPALFGVVVPTDGGGRDAGAYDAGARDASVAHDAGVVEDAGAYDAAFAGPDAAGDP